MRINLKYTIRYLACVPNLAHGSQFTPIKEMAHSIQIQQSQNISKTEHLQ